MNGRPYISERGLANQNLRGRNGLRQPTWNVSHCAPKHPIPPNVRSLNGNVSRRDSYGSQLISRYAFWT